MRRFELTMSVFLGDAHPLPDNFRDWIEVAGLCNLGASPTVLERIVETQYPLSNDVVDKRRGMKRPWA